MSRGSPPAEGRTPSETSPRRLLDRHGIHPSRRKGQSFLIQPGIARRIALAAEVTPDTGVIEIGPGLGMLTRALAPLCKRVIAIEMDARLTRVLREEAQLPPNVEILEADAVKTDYAALAKRLRSPATIVSNLPYAVSTPLLFRFLEAGPAIGRWVLMLQREVAERILAAPGTKTYGALSVTLGLFTQVTRLFNVGRANFYPRPDVDSTVLCFDLRPPGEVCVADPNLLRAVIRESFSQRRKTLANALATLLPVGGRSLLEAAGIDPKARGETLSPEDFARLANTLHNAGIRS